MIDMHTLERLNRRLRGIVNEDDVSEMVKACSHFPEGKHYVKIRDLGSTRYLDDSVGDTLACILHNGQVKTAMLCFSSQTWEDGKTWRLQR
jgi:hypothetical protein